MKDVTVARRATVRAALALCALLLALGASAAPAFAYRALLDSELLEVNPKLAIPPPEADIEGACGLAVSGGSLYVSDYYHRLIDVYSLGGTYSSQVHLAGGSPTGFGLNELDSVCGLAADASGNLYANEWHEGVERLLPSTLGLDSSESTGVAVDRASGNVYVDDRTYVAVYEPSGAAVLDGEGHPLKIGLGSLGDGYGVAVAVGGGRVYVPDGADNTVKVYEPPAEDPVKTIAGPGGGHFVSLVDAAATVDPTTGHLLLVDNLQPGFEHPRSAIYEFDSSGTFLSQMPTAPSGRAPVDGEPSGIAVDPASGNLFVTDGNGEESNVFEYGPYSSTPPLSAHAASAALGSGLEPDGGEAGPSAARGPAAQRSPRHPVASASEVIQRGDVRVALKAKLTPSKLPRVGAAPVRFSLSADIASTDGSVPPQLRAIQVEINRHGHFEPEGMPVCGIAEIQPSNNAGALEACRDALVGQGHFSAKVLIAQQAPFPSDGKVLAFNGRWHGRPAILAHIFGTEPVPTSYTLPFVIGDIAKGTYGTSLSASLPRFTSKWGYVTGISLAIGRSFHAGSRRHSYLTAGCPAPKGFPGGAYSIARASLGFGGRTIHSSLSGSCEVRP